MSRIAVIVVAGGQGTRMGTEVPKQFLLLDGVPVLFHTLRAFAAALEDRARQILVLPEAHRALWNSLCRQYRLEVPHEVCAGGENRFESVRNGLEQIGDAEWVAVHDGVRPLVSREVILRTVEEVQRHGAVIPVVRPVDSLRYLETPDTSGRIVDRSRFRVVQTPQVFRADWLREAYERPYSREFTDDASVVEASGRTVALCDGDYANIKITTPTDLLFAEAILQSRKSTLESKVFVCKFSKLNRA